jgi:hypothetical protein
MKQKYRIGDKDFFQYELVLWQEEELTRLAMPSTGLDNISLQSIITRLFVEDGLAKALAIILFEDSEKMTMQERENYLRDHITASMQAKVLQDFFACNVSAWQEWQKVGQEMMSRKSKNDQTSTK